MSGLSKLPTLLPLSQLHNLKYTANGSPDTSNLSPREIAIVLQTQMGFAQQAANLSPLELEQLKPQAEAISAKDAAQTLMAPYLDWVRETDHYTAAKEYAKENHYSSRDCFQIAVDDTLSWENKLAFYQVGLQKRTALKNMKRNFEEAARHYQEEDPAMKELEKKTQELLQKISNGVAGSDGQDATAASLG